MQKVCNKMCKVCNMISYAICYDLKKKRKVFLKLYKTEIKMSIVKKIDNYVKHFFSRSGKIKRVCVL